MWGASAPFQKCPRGRHWVLKCTSRFGVLFREVEIRKKGADAAQIGTKSVHDVHIGAGVRRSPLGSRSAYAGTFARARSTFPLFSCKSARGVHIALKGARASGIAKRRPRGADVGTFPRLAGPPD